LIKAKPKQYLNNKQLLIEIHKSKKTFCSYPESPDHSDFDLVVSSLDLVTDEIRAKLPPNPVIRVMTYEHIPLDPTRKRKDRNTEFTHAKTNFPPFKHYQWRQGEFVEVGRSHWVGPLDTGYFTAEAGAISNELALMFLTLVERYSRRPNWRGYSYVEEMRGLALVQLSQVGLKFDESKGDNPFAFYTTTIQNCFTRIASQEKKAQQIRDGLLEMHGQLPSYSKQIEHEFAMRAKH
jgi:hypothetical protein